MSTTTQGPVGGNISLDRTAPAYGGFNRTLLRIELMRILRNKRTMFFTVVLPVIFFFVFRANSFNAGAGNASAWLMISLALYGAFVANASTSAGVAVERAQGWSRQLRLTPLRGSAYIITKVLVSSAVSVIPLVVVYGLGLAFGAHAPVGDLVLAFVVSWIGSMLMAAFGLAVGFLLPSENAMQVLGMAMTVLAFGGGVFIPQPVFGHSFDLFARWTPMYGVTSMAHAGLAGWSGSWMWVLNIVGWAVVLGGAAVWLFRRDTGRV
ncbi:MULTISPECIES: ABC transporter permease [Allobranchiibius]|uniref:ABC-2 type transport system permease protein n=1 Tax=Allobranchiibius huperziae TaxID=1874116 RepID=A0A853DCF3_9MICO|nr:MULTISPECIES: ABC transporter permease [Allobranchiibius]MBO1768210.1 ABC transporter permease [Allobranchiibius sp. GilTou38]NYJ74267.1 ABC-2 type transport system permease protein [Allobranchiibius huperziae]